ncbi:MAG: DUF2946 family protein [Xanthobacteraceae bacterium]
MSLRGTIVFNLVSAARRAKPWVAMAVAYAVALQILLTSVLASQNVGALISADPARVDIICFGAGGDGGVGQGNANHAARQDCCVLCNGIVGPILPAANVPLPRILYAGAIVSYIAPDRAAPVVPQPTPRLSQGPPQNA